MAGYLRPARFIHTVESFPIAAGGGSAASLQTVKRKGRLVEIEIILEFDRIAPALGRSDQSIACDDTSVLEIAIAGRQALIGNVAEVKLAFSEPVDLGTTVMVTAQIGVIAAAGVVVVRKTYVV